MWFSWRRRTRSVWRLRPTAGGVCAIENEPALVIGEPKNEPMLLIVAHADNFVGRALDLELLLLVEIGGFQILRLVEVRCE